MLSLFLARVSTLLQSVQRYQQTSLHVANYPINALPPRAAVLRVQNSSTLEGKPKQFFHGRRHTHPLPYRFDISHQT